MNARRNEFMRSVEPVLDGLYGAAVRMTGSRSDADDLMQECLLHAYQAFDRFEAGTNLRAWLHRILLNAYISGYRRRVRERRALDFEADPSRRMVLLTDAQSQVEERDGGHSVKGISRTVQRALDELSPEFRAVVLMADVSELSYREIADALGCPIGTVMSRLHRGRRALAKKLAPQLGLAPSEESAASMPAVAAA